MHIGSFSEPVGCAPCVDVHLLLAPREVWPCQLKMRQTSPAEPFFDSAIAARVDSQILASIHT